MFSPEFFRSILAFLFQDGIITENNLTLCHADYFQACWCKWNSSQPSECTYLLRYAKCFSNTSYFCIYHIIRNTIECFDSKYILPKYSISTIPLYFSRIFFLIGLIGNGISILILLSTKLRYLSIYRNLTILCLLNILYLISIFVREENFAKQDLRNISVEFCRLHVFFTAILGHLCSWQLVSTSVQRVHALLSLQSHRTTSWVCPLRKNRESAKCDLRQFFQHLSEHV